MRSLLFVLAALAAVALAQSFPPFPTTVFYGYQQNMLNDDGGNGIGMMGADLGAGLERIDMLMTEAAVQVFVNFNTEVMWIAGITSSNQTFCNKYPAPADVSGFFQDAQFLRPDIIRGVPCEVFLVNASSVGVTPFTVWVTPTGQLLQVVLAQGDNLIQESYYYYPTMAYPNASWFDLPS